MELSERCIAQLEKEGYATVYERQDDVGTTLTEAGLDTAVALFVSEGTLAVVVKDKEILLRTGERIDIPAHVPYSTTAGPQGCQLVIGEMG